MKRPLAVIGFSYLAALRVAFIIGIEYAVTLSVVCAVIAVIAFLWKRIRLGGAVPAAFCGAAAALVILSAFSFAFVTPAQGYIGKTGNISAQLVDLPYKQNDRYYYKLKIISSDIDAASGVTALVSSAYSYQAEPYDTINTRVSFFDSSSDSFKNYSISRGIYARGSVVRNSDTEILQNDNKPVYYYVLMLKKTVLETIDRLLPEKEAALVSAMLLSDKTGLDDYTKTTFQAAGVSHIIVVSGFHLTIIVQLFSLFLAIFIKNRQIRSLLSVGTVILFMALTGFTPSIMRAGIMQTAVLLSAASYRHSDTLNSLGLAALIICFLNPYTSADIGFLLSFYATLGIVLCEPHISDYLSGKMKISKVHEERKTVRQKKLSVTFALYLISVVSVTLSAVLFTTPVTVLYFKSFALYSVLFNLLISPAASLLLCFAVMMVLIGLIPYVGVIIALPFAFCCRMLADYIYSVASLSRLMPYSLVSASHDYIPACLLLSVGILILLLIMMKSKKRAAFFGAISAVMIFTFCAVFSGIMELDSRKVSVVDTGDGLSVVYQTSGETAVLFCGGDRGDHYILEDYFQLSDIRDISYLLLTDYSNTDAGYAKYLLEDMKVSMLHIYDRDRFPERTKQAAENCETIIDCSYKDKKINTVRFADTTIFVYRCYGCCAVYFEAGGSSFLVLSDMTDCELIPEDWRAPDHLIINGIVDNTGLLKPETIILSDSRENIGEDLHHINCPESELYCTGGDGTVSVRVYADGTARIRRENQWLS